jgi:hypothetical protein
MLGQFVFPTLPSLGLGLRCIFRNTPRGEIGGIPFNHVDHQMEVSIKGYREGVCIFEDPRPIIVPYGGFYELNHDNCLNPDLFDLNSLVVAECKVGGQDRVYFPQEHQLIYTNIKTGTWTSLLYDQVPIPSSIVPGSPTILIAPKIWVSNNVNTHIIFSNASDLSANNANEITLSILTQDGKIIHTERKPEKYNNLWVYDVRKAVEKKIKICETPLHLTLVARGGTSRYIIASLIQNQETGSMALEHSLSPHYYFSGDRQRVRNEALFFESVNL